MQRSRTISAHATARSGLRAAAVNARARSVGAVPVLRELYPLCQKGNQEESALRVMKAREYEETACSPCELSPLIVAWPLFFAI